MSEVVGDRAVDLLKAEDREGLGDALSGLAAQEGVDDGNPERCESRRSSSSGCVSRRIFSSMDLLNPLRIVVLVLHKRLDLLFEPGQVGLDYGPYDVCIDLEVVVD